MDLKYLLCEPISRLSVQANPIELARKQPIDLEWPTKPIYHTNQQEWYQDQPTMIISSPRSVCSSISACSSTSSTSSQDDLNHVTSPHNHLDPSRLYPYQSRRRTASDVSLTRHHMFIYSHPNRRPRSKSTGNNDQPIQTRTPWTPFEDHLLRQGYDQGLSWAMISSTYLPHRSRGCCWGRFKTLQNKNMVDPAHSQMRHFRRPWKAIDFHPSQ
ncbi:hypothetical protein A0J61_02879 [Choanephora cucurbitarum]|uniref:Myb-like domain-containing protein n=1 Tax=Choanephora cucurbitarum TaxID=101091 RepID=A0A1C7NJ02_9FUNG|nr:hypothetical protein A0J61_02879 [Choanephora cucurbitarum]